MPIRNTQFVCNLWIVDTSTGGGKTGDLANIALYTSKDGGSSAACTNNGSKFEVDATNQPGVIAVTLTATEMDGHSIEVGGKSITSGVTIRPTFIGTDNGTIAALSTKVGTPAGASVSADIGTTISQTTTAALKTGVDSALDATNTELPNAAAAPAGTATLRAMIKWMFSFRGKVTSVKATGVRTVYKADGTTPLMTTTATDDTNTFTKPADS